jgi:hypothetical protein
MVSGVVFFNDDLGHSSRFASAISGFEARHFPLHVSTCLSEMLFFFGNVAKKHVVKNYHDVADDGQSNHCRHDENAPSDRGPKIVTQTRLECVGRGQSYHHDRNCIGTAPAHTQSVTPTETGIVAKSRSCRGRVPKREPGHSGRAIRSVSVNSRIAA